MRIIWWVSDTARVRHVIADFLNPSFCLRIQPSDKVSESRDLFLNSQIAIGLALGSGYT